tara:strand:+ start:2670 stop:3020 length:351 start_codon:yes stop_codon:yes gene_type:complete
MLNIGGCSAQPLIDQSCYYLVTANEREIRALGQGLEPIAPVLDQLVREAFQGRRTVVPAVRDATFIFADRCDFQDTENFVDSGFRGQGFSYDITRITKEDYKVLAEELRTSTPTRP